MSDEDDPEWGGSQEQEAEEDEEYYDEKVSDDDFEADHDEDEVSLPPPPKKHKKEKEKKEKPKEKKEKTKPSITKTNTDASPSKRKKPSPSSSTQSSSSLLSPNSLPTPPRTSTASKTDAKASKKKTTKSTKAASSASSNGDAASASSSRSSSSPKKQKKENSKHTGGEKKPAKVATGDAAKDLILNYLIQQNRPYSHTQIFENLHQQVGKSQVPKILESLAQAGFLAEFVFGKTKLYLASQDSSSSEVDPSALSALDAQLETLQKEVQLSSQKTSSLQGEVNKLQREQTTADAAIALKDLQAKVASKQAKLQALKKDGNVVDKSALDKLQKQFNTLYTAWKKRKYAEKEIVETMLENAPKSMNAKKYREKLGIELDEEVPVKIEDYAPLYKKM